MLALLTAASSAYFSFKGLVGNGKCFSNFNGQFPYQNHKEPQFHQT